MAFITSEIKIRVSGGKDLKDKQEKTTAELLQRMSEHNKKMKIRKLENDEQGRLLLDPNNPHDREWYFNDDAYEQGIESRQDSEKS